ncbi:MAG: peroxiredoxin family protein [Pyrinomonadaceae bacterium]|nr:TlpA family protein disulfide reductase [Blastocatellia bacterium]
MLTELKFSFALAFFLASLTFAAVGQVSVQQSPAPAPAGKTILRDSDGNTITNNEFVDIRMANFHYPDATRMKTLDDGTVEFRLQKVPQEGMNLPDFSARKIDGTPLAASDLSGKVVVLNFWFIGCPVCFSEMPKLNALAAKFVGNENVVFVAMTADPAGSVKKFLAREKFDYQMIGDAKPVLKMFGFSGYPKNIVISKEGRIVYWRSTIKAWDKFESVIQAELNKK